MCKQITIMGKLKKVIKTWLNVENIVIITNKILRINEISVLINS